ncbi:MAG: Gfo/Idh/MocA family oxidoreductase [Clostridiales bacterium]|nr:Gfo/Idh/MocA family oxidoreductase [Clostridiales bacterium]
MGEKIRIGVIGTGNMGRNHVRVLSEASDFDLVSVFDVQAERAHALAMQYHVSASASAEALMDAVDAVVIAAPSFLHKELGLLAAERGIHALIEKPLALNCEDAEILCRAFANAKKKLMIGHVERFNPVLTELVKLLNGEEVIAVEAVRYSPFDGRITDTDVVYDLMIHDIDIVCNALCDQEIVGISGFGVAVKSGMTDFANCLLRFENGVLAKLSASRVTESKVRMIQVHTLRSYIIADLLNRTLTVLKQTNMIVENSNSSYRQESISQRIFVPMVEPLKMELLSLHHCIANDTEPAINGAHAVKALRVAADLRNAF